MNGKCNCLIISQLTPNELCEFLCIWVSKWYINLLKRLKISHVKKMTNAST